MPIVTNSGGQAALFKGNDSCYIMQKRPLESANGYNYEVCCRPGSYNGHISSFNSGVFGVVSNNTFTPWIDNERKSVYVYVNNSNITVTDFEYNVYDYVKAYSGYNANSLKTISLKGIGYEGYYQYPHTTLPAYKFNDKFFNATTIDLFDIYAPKIKDGDTTFYGPVSENSQHGVYGLRHFTFVGICHPLYSYGATLLGGETVEINADRKIRYAYDTHEVMQFSHLFYTKNEKSVKKSGINKLKTTYNITNKDLKLMPIPMFYYSQLCSIVALVTSPGWESTEWIGNGRVEHKLHKYYAVNNGENYFDKYVNTQHYFYCNIFPQCKTNDKNITLAPSKYSNNSKSGFTKMVQPSTTDWRYSFWRNEIYKDYTYEAPSVAGVVKEVMFFSGAMNYIKNFDIASTGAIEIGDETATGKTVIRQRFPYITVPYTGRSAVKGIYFKGGINIGNADIRIVRTNAIKCFWCCNMSANNNEYYRTGCSTSTSYIGTYGGEAFLDTIYKYEFYDVPKYEIEYHSFSYINSTTKGYSYDSIRPTSNYSAYSGGISSGTLTANANYYKTDLIIEYKINSKTTLTAIKGSTRNALTNSGLFIDAYALYKTLEGWGLVTAKYSGNSTDDAVTRAKKGHYVTISEREAMIKVITGNEDIKCYMKCLGTNDYLQYKPNERSYSKYTLKYNNKNIWMNEWNNISSFDTYLLPFAKKTECNYSALQTIGNTVTKVVQASGHTFRANSAYLYSSHDSEIFNCDLHSWEICKHYNYDPSTGCSPKY